MMKERLDKIAAAESQDGLEAGLAMESAPNQDFDPSLLEESLAKTPWERMQANDDAVRFADSLRAAMEKRNAESKRTDA